MYPDYPESAADLVPLPLGDGPKLKAFDYGDSQNIEFVQYLGWGLHSYVFKIKVVDQVYALKLFKFPLQNDWLGPSTFAEPNDLDAMSAFYKYSDPFTCECRAFGRLQEAGHEDLAIKCFGYVLLDEDQEQKMLSGFSDLNFCWNGPGDEHDVRSIFPGKNDRLPPIRGIVKSFGQSGLPLRNKGARNVLRDVIRLQQLGICNIDVAHRQLVDGKISDFSTTITTPHFLTTPELNPQLTPEWIPALEYETFMYCIADYWDFDGMVNEWNRELEEAGIDDPRKQVSVRAFPNGEGCRIKYNLRRTPARDRVYTLVDPRRYDWRNSIAAGTGGSATGATGNAGNPGGAAPRRRRRLDPRPPRWYLECDSQVADNLKELQELEPSLYWEYENGLIFPRDSA